VCEDAEMYRNHHLVMVAESEHHRQLLANYNAPAMVLESGIYLIRKDIANDDIALVRAITHEDFEVLMQREEHIAKQLSSTKYTEFKRRVLDSERIMRLYAKVSHYQKPETEPDNIIFHDAVAKAFELMFVIDQEVVNPAEDLDADEREFVKLMRPILEEKNKHGVYKYYYFPAEFFNVYTRMELVLKLQKDEDVEFYPVAASPYPKDEASQTVYRNLWRSVLKWQRDFDADNYFARENAIKHLSKIYCALIEAGHHVPLERFKEKLDDVEYARAAAINALVEINLTLIRKNKPLFGIDALHEKLRELRSDPGRKGEHSYAFNIPVRKLVWALGDIEVALFKEGKDPVSQDILGEMFFDGDQIVSERLCTIGKEINTVSGKPVFVDALRCQMDSEFVTVREKAVLAIAYVKNKESYPELIDILKHKAFDEDDSVSWAAVFALAKSGIAALDRKQQFKEIPLWDLGNIGAAYVENNLSIEPLTEIEWDTHNLTKGNQAYLINGLARIDIALINKGESGKGPIFLPFIQKVLPELVKKRETYANTDSVDPGVKAAFTALADIDAALIRNGRDPFERMIPKEYFYHKDRDIRYAAIDVSMKVNDALSSKGRGFEYIKELKTNLIHPDVNVGGAAYRAMAEIVILGIKNGKGTDYLLTLENEFRTMLKRVFDSNISFHRLRFIYVEALCKVNKAIIETGFPPRTELLEEFLELDTGLDWSDFDDVYLALVKISAYLIENNEKPLALKESGHNVQNLFDRFDEKEAMMRLYAAYARHRAVDFGGDIAKINEFWRKHELPHDSDRINEFFNFTNVDEYLEYLRKKAEKFVTEGFSGYDHSDRWFAYLALRLEGIHINFDEFMQRMDTLIWFDKQFPDRQYWHKLFRKNHDYNPLEISTTHVRELDTSQVDQNIFDTHLNKLHQIKTRTDSLSWMERSFPKHKVFNIRNIYYSLKREDALASGELKEGERFRIEFPSEDEMRTEIVKDKKRLYKVLFELLSTRLTDSKIGTKCLYLMRNLVVSEILEDAAFVKQLRSDDINTRISTFKTFYEDHRNHLPNAIGRRTDEIKGLIESLEILAQPVYQEITKAQYIYKRADDSYTLVPVGFIGVFHGRAGIVDCACDMGYGTPFTRAMHEDTVYYYVYKGKELKGYVGLMWGEDEDKNKILTIDTIEAPSLDGYELLMNLLKGFHEIAVEHGGKGIALPEYLYPSFNFDNQDTIADLPVYQEGEPVFIRPRHKKQWNYFTEKFGKVGEGDFLEHSMEYGNFVYLKLSDDQPAGEFSFEKGKEKAREVISGMGLSRGDAKEILEKLKQGSAFEWKYKEWGVNEKTIHESKPGVKGFLKGFRKLGTLGKWSMMFHSSNQKGKGDILSYLREVTEDFTQLEPVFDFIKTLRRSVPKKDELRERIKRDLTALGFAEEMMDILKEIAKGRNEEPAQPSGNTELEVNDREEDIESLADFLEVILGRHETITMAKLLEVAGDQMPLAPGESVDDRYPDFEKSVREALYLLLTIRLGNMTSETNKDTIDRYIDLINKILPMQAAELSGQEKNEISRLLVDAVINTTHRGCKEGILFRFFEIIGEGAMPYIIDGLKGIMNSTPDFPVSDSHAGDYMKKMRRYLQVTEALSGVFNHFGAAALKPLAEFLDEVDNDSIWADHIRSEVCKTIGNIVDFQRNGTEGNVKPLIQPLIKTAQSIKGNSREASFAKNAAIAAIRETAKAASPEDAIKYLQPLCGMFEDLEEPPEDAGRDSEAALEGLSTNVIRRRIAEAISLIIQMCRIKYTEEVEKTIQPLINVLKDIQLYDDDAHQARGMVSVALMDIGLAIIQPLIETMNSLTEDSVEANNAKLGMGYVSHMIIEKSKADQRHEFGAPLVNMLNSIKRDERDAHEAIKHIANLSLFYLVQKKVISEEDVTPVVEALNTSLANIKKDTESANNARGGIGVCLRALFRWRHEFIHFDAYNESFRKLRATLVSIDPEAKFVSESRVATFEFPTGHGIEAIRTLSQALAAVMQPLSNFLPDETATLPGDMIALIQKIKKVDEKAILAREAVIEVIDAAGAAGLTPLLDAFKKERKRKTKKRQWEDAAVKDYTIGAFALGLNCMVQKCKPHEMISSVDELCGMLGELTGNSESTLYARSQVSNALGTIAKMRESHEVGPEFTAKTDEMIDPLLAALLETKEEEERDGKVTVTRESIQRGLASIGPSTIQPIIAALQDLHESNDDVYATIEVFANVVSSFVDPEKPKDQAEPETLVPVVTQFLLAIRKIREEAPYPEKVKASIITVIGLISAKIKDKYSREVDQVINYFIEVLEDRPSLSVTIAVAGAFFDIGTETIKPLHDALKKTDREETDVTNRNKETLAHVVEVIAEKNIDEFELLRPVNDTLVDLAAKTTTDTPQAIDARKRITAALGANITLAREMFTERLAQELERENEEREEDKRVDIDKFIKKHAGAFLLLSKMDADYAGQIFLSFLNALGPKRLDEFFDYITPLIVNPAYSGFLPIIYEHAKDRDHSFAMKIVELAAAYHELKYYDLLKEVVDEVKRTKPSLRDINTMLGERLFKKFAGDFLGIELTSIPEERINEWNLPYLGKLFVARKLIHKKGPGYEPLQKLLDSTIRSALEGRFNEFITDPESGYAMGKEVAEHNAQLRERLKSLGINVDRWLDYDVETPDTIKSKRGALDLEPDFINITTYLASLLALLQDENAERRQVVEGSFRKIGLNIEFSTEGELSFTCATGNDDRTELEAVARHFQPEENRAILWKTLDFMEKKTKIEGVRAMIGHIKSEIDGMCEKIKRFEDQKHKGELEKKVSIRVWKRSPGRDIFQGSFTHCCVALDNTLHPEAIVEYLIDQGIQVVEMVEMDDGKPGKTIAQAFCFMGEDEQGRPVLVMDSVQIAGDYKETTEQRKAIRDSIFAYVKQYGIETGCRALYAGATPFQDVDVSDYDLIPNGIKKSGGYLWDFEKQGFQYYLEALVGEDRKEPRKEIRFISNLSAEAVNAGESVPGCPASLLREMLKDSIYEDKPKTSKQFALERGGLEKLRTIQREIQILKEIDLIEGNRNGYYLPAWLRNIDIEEFIVKHPALSKADPSDDEKRQLREEVLDVAWKAAKTNGEKAQYLLSDWKRRPEPRQVERLSLKAIREGARGAFGMNDEDISAIRKSATFIELENLLPFLYEMVETILKTSFKEYEKILIAGRDGEPFYDALKTILKGTEYEDRIVMFPASGAIRSRLLGLIEGQEYTLSKRQRFLENMGMTKEAINEGRRFLIIDTGMVGTVSKNLREIAQGVYPDEPGIRNIHDIIDTKLVYQTPYRFYEPIHPIQEFFIGRDRLRQMFPKTKQMMEGDSCFTPTGIEANYWMLVSLQTLPKYMEEYAYVDADGNGIPLKRRARFSGSGKDQWQIDKVRDVNDTIINPVAAMMVQKTIIAYFKKRRRELLSLVIPPGAPVTLFREMYGADVYADKSKKSRQLAIERGNINKRSTIQRELAILQDLRIIEGDEKGYYLADWVKGMDIEKFIDENPELNKASLDIDDRRRVRDSAHQVMLKKQWVTGLWDFEQCKEMYNKYLNWKCPNAWRLEASLGALTRHERILFGIWAGHSRTAKMLVERGENFIYMPAAELKENLGEIDKGITDGVRHESSGKKPLPYLWDVLKLAEQKKLVAHGTLNNSAISGDIDDKYRAPRLRHFWAIFNIMMEGFIRDGEKAALDKSLSPYKSADYGPYYVIFKEFAPHQNYMSFAGGEPYENHAIYLVPRNKDVKALRKGFDEAIALGMVQAEHVENVMSKVMTYRQFVKHADWLEGIVRGEIIPEDVLVNKGKGRLTLEQAAKSLYHKVRNTEFIAPLSKLSGPGQRVSRRKKYKLCLPVEVLKNSADIVNAFEKLDKVPFELIVTGVMRKDMDLVNNLKSVTVRRSLGLPEKLSVSVVEEDTIRKVAKKYKYNYKDPLRRAQIVYNMYVGALKKNEYLAVATVSKDKDEAKALVRQLRPGVDQESRISMRLLVNPDSIEDTMYSLSSLVYNWFKDIDDGKISSVRKIDPIPISPLDIEQLRRFLDKAMTILRSA